MAREDIEAAKARMAPSIGYWRDIDATDGFVASDETVERMLAGQLDGAGGVLVLTHARVLFVSDGGMPFAIERSSISQARCDYGAVFATFTLATHDRRIVIRHVDRYDGIAFAKALGGRARRAMAPAS